MHSARGWKFVLAAACGAALFAAPARAQDSCNKPLRLLESLPMTDMGGGVVSVPIGFNGVQKQFLLDTGGIITQVSSQIADELKLYQQDSSLELYGSAGQVSRKFTVLKDFRLGKLAASKLEVIVSKFDMDGIFAPVGFTGFDFEMDFTGHKFNIISNDHCDGKVIYWPAQAIAAVPVDTADHHLSVPVTVDGIHLKAIIDTGASISVMRLDIARRAFGLDAGSADMRVIGHMNEDEKAIIYAHAFKTLTFEGVTVNNPHIEILTDVVNKNADHTNQIGSLVKKQSDDLTLPEFIVGMDVLRKLRLYLALKEKKLYLTEASTPASSPPPAP